MNFENNEILYIESDKVNIILKGDSDSYDRDNTINLSTIISGNDVTLNNVDYHIYLKEYKNYELIIESLGEYDISFYHENINIRNKVSQIGKSGRLLGGIINFKGDIGYSDFYIKVNNEEHIKVTLEVRPTKIDYKNDYVAILNDINKEVYNLAYGFLARTYLSAEIKESKGSLSEFYSILDYTFDKLKKALSIVIYNPYECLVRDERIVKYHSIRNPKVDTFKWLEKRGYLFKDINGKLRPEEALVIRKRVTYDNNENRFLKFMLEDIIKSIEGFKLTYNIKNNKNKEQYSKISVDTEIINRLEVIKNYFVKILKTTFLKSIDSSFYRGDISLVFRMKAGYKEVYKYYLMLKKGLTIRSNMFSISMKELSLLYEYWCFIKINSILKENYNLVSTDIIKINKDSIIVTIKKGKSSKITYENPKTKERLMLIYNAKSYSATVAQKPDNILEIKKENNNGRNQYIFDAKYKIEASSSYIKTYNGVGPKEEDINTMHRYRDAIMYSEKNKTNSIKGAFVLFPYSNEEEYRKQKFYQTIDEVNIGGIPFLPSTTELMRTFLEEIINEEGKILNKEIDNVTYIQYKSQV